MDEVDRLNRSGGPTKEQAQEIAEGFKRFANDQGGEFILGESALDGPDKLG
ncbi:MAG: hypothetical protein ACYDD1_06780 [Caulobacteraceae bacterium]